MRGFVVSTPMFGKPLPLTKPLQNAVASKRARTDASPALNWKARTQLREEPTWRLTSKSSSSLWSSPTFLKFGSFTLKSGRQSPFFMNAGAYVTGYQLKKLGEYYAQAIHDNFGDDFDVLFGPAYKGIPLAVVTAIAYHELYGKEVKYCCDRKEAKDHGADKGNLLGYEPQDGDRVIMVEDVTTSGKSIDETYPKVKAAADVEIKGLIVSLNRMEVGKGGVTTAQKEIEAKYGFPVASIVSMAEVVETLYNHEIDGKVVIDDELKTAIDAYYEQYGARE